MVRAPSIPTSPSRRWKTCTCTALLPHGLTAEKALYHYTKAVNKGLLKVFSKMGISTLQSYRGAQVFEAIGLNKELIDKYFTGTPSRIEGVGLELLAREAVMKHEPRLPSDHRNWTPNSPWAAIINTACAANII